MRGMMKMFFSPAVKPEDTTYSSTVDSIDGMTFLKHGYWIFKLDGLCRRRSMEMMTDDDGNKFSADPLPRR